MTIVELGSPQMAPSAAPPLPAIVPLLEPPWPPCATLPDTTTESRVSELLWPDWSPVKTALPNVDPPPPPAPAPPSPPSPPVTVLPVTATFVSVIVPQLMMPPPTALTPGLPAVAAVPGPTLPPLIVTPLMSTVTSVASTQITR